MYNKFYMIVFDPTKLEIASEIHNAVSKSQYISDWWHYLPSAYIVQSQYTLATIQTYLTNNTKVLPRKFLIIEVNLTNSNGWLPKEAWAWIRKRR